MTTEKVEIIDVRIVIRQAIHNEACTACNRALDTAQALELTIRSTRGAQITALVHPTCAMQSFDHLPVNLHQLNGVRQRGQTDASL